MASSCVLELGFCSTSTASAGRCPRSAGLAATGRVEVGTSRVARNALRLVRASSGVTTKRLKSPAEEDWKIKRETLKKNKVRSVSAKEAQRLQEEQGYSLLDVRPEHEFNKMHPIGATNVELYRLIREWTAWDIARRLGFAFFGIFEGTEENPNFLADVRAKIDSKSKVIVACASGGTMKPTPTLSEGQQSRSLIAAYMLVVDGFTNVLHLEGGLRSWYQDRLPTEEAAN